MLDLKDLQALLVWIGEQTKELSLRFGTGGEKDHATGAIHKIKAVVFYVLDQHDNHTLSMDDGMDMFLISVFNPALQGDEVHGEDGSYSA